jgi:hypothetical protein
MFSAFVFASVNCKCLPVNSSKMHTEGGVGGEELRFEKLGRKNAIKHEKWDPMDFLTTPSTPLKRICWKPQ